MVRAAGARRHATTAGGDMKSETNEGFDQLLTVEQAAALLNVKPGWLYLQTRHGPKCPVPHLRIGRYVRFERAACWAGSQSSAWAAGERSPFDEPREPED